RVPPAIAAPAIFGARARASCGLITRPGPMRRPQWQAISRASAAAPNRVPPRLHRRNPSSARQRKPPSSLLLLARQPRTQSRVPRPRSRRAGPQPPPPPQHRRAWSPKSGMPSCRRRWHQLRLRRCWCRSKSRAPLLVGCRLGWLSWLTILRRRLAGAARLCGLWLEEALGFRFDLGGVLAQNRNVLAARDARGLVRV